MNLQCKYVQILIIMCFSMLDKQNNQVDAKHKTMDKSIGDNYGKYDIQESPQGFKNYTELYELDKVREMPKMIIKKLRKHKKKWKKTDEKEKYIMMRKKKISKNKLYEKSKRRKSPTKFVKTISEKNKDSNMSGSKEVGPDDVRKPDVVVHIEK